MQKLVKKYIPLIVITFLISLMPVNNTYAANSETLTREQKALKAVARALYNKGSLVQYCSYRKTFMSKPEDATSQNIIYSVCSDFTYTVYKNALGMEIIPFTNQISAYGMTYYNKNNIKTNDIIEFWEHNNNKYYDNKGKEKKEINLSTSDGKKEYIKDLLQNKKLQTGDLLCYTIDDGEGHIAMVYEVKYTNNKPTSATLIEVSSKYNTTDNKIKKGLSYRKSKNNSTGIVEGAVRQKDLSVFIDKLPTVRYFTIYRPLLKDNNGNLTGKYYKATINKTGSEPPVYYTCSGRTLQNYSVTAASSSRLKYPHMTIDKTVDKYNGSNVSLGGKLTYTIKIVNKTSKTTYKDLNVTENISEYVTVEDKGGGTQTGNTLKWKIATIAPGKTYEIKYTVKVNNKKENLGKIIKSTGKVANIQSATVTNKISKNLKSEYKTKIKDKAKTLFSSKKYTGKELIENIYKEALGKGIGINDLKINELVLTRGGIDYFSESNKAKVRLGSANGFKEMVLRNYYGSVYTNSAGYVYLRKWENIDYDKRDQRADTLYNSNFQTGDVLVYQNKQNPSSGQTFPKEDGTYYFIYLSKSDKIKVDGKELYGFIGLNKNKKLKQITTDYLELQNLLSKDCYVILRPAQTIDFKVGEATEAPPTKPTSSPSASTSSSPTSSPSASVSSSPSSSASGSPTSSTEPTATTSPSTSGTGKPSSSPSQSEPTWPINPPANYTFKVESDIDMSQLLLYRKVANGKYVLFYKVPLDGQREYSVTLRKSQLTKIGDSPLKLVIVGRNGERDVQNITISQ